ncbi:MAG: SatD family protein [Porphyromonas sp.]|nr:SatD family protein [Porphyromonas sp.]
MDIRGVITGDIVASSAIRAEYRDILPGGIEEIVQKLSAVLSPAKMEVFRGDSFQIVVERPEETVRMAVLLRAGIKGKTPEEVKRPWDVRLAIGIGEISYLSDKVVLSDGEAFHLSGRELDDIGKRRLTVRTRWEELNEELEVSTAFADDIISRWTVSQAKVLYEALLHGTTQKEMGLNMGMSSQNVGKLLRAGKENLIALYLNRTRKIIKNRLV